MVRLTGEHQSLNSSLLLCHKGQFSDHYFSQSIKKYQSNSKNTTKSITTILNLQHGKINKYNF